MKILGLSTGQFFAALVFGVIVSVAVTFAMAPHPVNVPVQTITPVPTPPPVVITEQPRQASVTSSPWNVTVMGVNDAVANAMLALGILLIAMGILGVITATLYNF